MTREFTTLPIGAAAAPQGTGSVKAARVYDHGLCSARIALAPFYDDIQFNFFFGFADKAGGLLSFPFLQWSHMDTLLDHTPGRAPTEVDDGFVFDLRYGINNDIPFAGDDDIFATAAFRLLLTDGVLDAALDGAPTLKIIGPKALDIGQGLDSAFANDLPAAIHSASMSMQAQAIPGIGDLTCSVVDDCRANANLLGLAASQGAGILGLSSIATALNESVGGNNNHANLHKHWICERPADSREGTCELVVPARRLNVFPDEAELVWFDGLDEANNVALALFAATFAKPGLEAARAELCQARHSNNREGFFRRPFATDDFTE